MSTTASPGPTPGPKPAPAARPAPAPAAARPAPGPVTARPAPAGGPPADVVMLESSDEPEVPTEEELEARHRYHFLMFTAMPSWMVSAVVHAVIVVLLAVWTIDNTQKQDNTIVAENFGPAEEIQEFKDDVLPQPVDVLNTSVATSAAIPESSAVDVPPEVTDVGMANDVEAVAVAVDLVDFGERTAPRNDLTKTIGAVTGKGVDGRGAAARAAMVAQGGGNAASEAAVANALKWIVTHQMPDGGWNFDHRIGACQGQCSEAGKMTNARNGATGLALLPLLGAGQTHKEGPYKENVRRGLYFLMQSMKPQNGGGSLIDGGNMYSHGICSIVLCEAYAMTHDRELMAPAQASINFIVYAQDPVGGGWRYSPRQPGDTSAVGWQLMALKSAHMAYLNVPPATVAGAVKFLDSVQADSGSKYGYTGPGAGQATTSVGLLSRMYLGWKKDNPSLQRGVQYLAATKPSRNNMYYNYYATQVMRHNEGEEWQNWNKEMRDWLVDAQGKQGHEKGSWMMKGGDHGADVGGRLYCTSMATMILEVYYRHMPIYGKAAAEEDFPL
ncbi:MAG TPA: terpene cyclase/mutase family protein [Pirellulaceae bacterium]|nr:terpene cyclase/mutase family protein [Pirellulaceae bacterium]